VPDPLVVRERLPLVVRERLPLALAAAAVAAGGVAVAGAGVAVAGGAAFLTGAAFLIFSMSRASSVDGSKIMIGFLTTGFLADALVVAAAGAASAFAGAPPPWPGGRWYTIGWVGWTKKLGRG